MKKKWDDQWRSSLKNDYWTHTHSHWEEILHRKTISFVDKNSFCFFLEVHHRSSCVDDGITWTTRIRATASLAWHSLHSCVDPQRQDKGFCSARDLMYRRHRKKIILRMKHLSKRVQRDSLLGRAKPVVSSKSDFKESLQFLHLSYCLPNHDLAEKIPSSSSLNTFCIKDWLVFTTTRVVSLEFPGLLVLLDSRLFQWFLFKDFCFFKQRLLLNPDDGFSFGSLTWMTLINREKSR